MADQYPYDERGPYAARLREKPEQGPDTPAAYAVGLAPEAWPVEAGDEITDGVDLYVIVGKPLLSAVPGHPDVDYVRCEATKEPPKVP